MADALLLTHSDSPLEAATRSRLWHHQLINYGLITALAAAVPVTLFFNPAFGAYLAAGSLAALMAVAVGSQAMRPLVLPIAIIPLLGMVNLSVFQDSAFEQTAILYGSMLVLALVYRRILAPAITANAHMSWRGYAAGLPAMVLLGGLLGLIGSKLLATAYVFGGTSLWQVAAVAVVGACAEELLFRGLIQRQAARLTRALYAAILTTSLYAALSLSHFTGWSLLVGLVSGGIISTVYSLKPNLILTTTLNLASKLAYVGLTAALIFR